MKRKVPRRAIRYPVRLDVAEMNGKNGNGVMLVNLSPLGAALESPIPLASRNPVNFTVWVPGKDMDIRFSGVVVWFRPLMAKPGTYFIGVRFQQPYWDLDQLGRNGKLADDGQ